MFLLALSEKLLLLVLPLVRWVVVVVPVWLLAILFLPPAVVLTLRELFFQEKSAKRLRCLNDVLPVKHEKTRVWRLFYSRFLLRLNQFSRFWVGQFNLPKWQARIECDGIDRLQNMVHQGRSVILATVHYGCTTDAVCILRMKGFRLAGMVYDHQVSNVERAIYQSASESVGLENVPFSIRTVDLWEARDFLRDPGSMLAITIDRANRKRDETCELWGRDVRVAAGVTKFAEIANAVILPSLFTSVGFMRWRLWFGEPISFENNLDSGETYQKIFSQLSPQIMRCPEQMQPDLIAAMLPRDTFKRPKTKPLTRKNLVSEKVGSPER